MTALDRVLTCLTIAIAIGCGDDTAKNCLPEQPPHDPEMVDPINAPFCDTTVFGIPNRRPEFAYGPYAITVCRDDETASADCDGCAFEDWKADLLAEGEAYLAESSADACENDSMRVDHMEPECYLQLEDERCCYRAVIWSNTCEYYVIAHDD